MKITINVQKPDGSETQGTFASYPEAIKNLQASNEAQLEAERQAKEAEQAKEQEGTKAEKPEEE